MIKKILFAVMVTTLPLPSVAMAKSSECPSECDRIAGDVDGDGYVGYNDVNALSRWLYVGLSKGVCLKAADVNGDGVIDMTDAHRLADYVWNGGPAPVSQSLPGDINNDGDVNIADMVSLGQWLWGGMGEVCETNADINEDGYIDISDFTLLGAMY